MPVAGHIPKSVTLAEALMAGQKSIEHARMLPLACSDQEQRYADAYHDWLMDTSGKNAVPLLGDSYNDA